MNYIPKGTCSRQISFEIEDNIVKSVEFVGGCAGNSKGISRLVEGMEIHEAVRRMEGIDCAGRGTSCPDQLARALKLYLQKK